MTTTSAIPDKNPIPNNKKFGIDQEQPSPEAKKKGWERKRAKQEIMDKITEIRNISFKELQELQEDIKNNPQNHTVLEVKLVQYLSKEKFTIDFLDRNIGKAPQDIDITTQGEKINSVVVKFIDKMDEKE